MVIESKLKVTNELHEGDGKNNKEGVMNDFFHS